MRPWSNRVASRIETLSGQKVCLVAAVKPGDRMVPRRARWCNRLGERSPLVRERVVHSAELLSIGM